MIGNSLHVGCLCSRMVRGHNPHVFSFSILCFALIVCLWPKGFVANPFELKIWLYYIELSCFGSRMILSLLICGLAPFGVFVDNLITLYMCCVTDIFLWVINNQIPNPIFHEKSQISIFFKKVMKMVEKSKSQETTNIEEKIRELKKNRKSGIKGLRQRWQRPKSRTHDKATTVATSRAGGID